MVSSMLMSPALRSMTSVRRLPVRMKTSKIARSRRPWIVSLSSLAHVGSRSEAELRATFEQGALQLRGIEPALLPLDRCGLAELDSALEQLAQASPSCVQQLLTACAGCIAADRTVTQAEGELLRAIADALACPIPPLLPGQPLA